MNFKEHSKVKIQSDSNNFQQQNDWKHFSEAGHCLGRTQNSNDQNQFAD